MKLIRLHMQRGTNFFSNWSTSSYSFNSMKQTWILVVFKFFYFLLNLRVNLVQQRTQTHSLTKLLLLLSAYLSQRVGWLTIFSKSRFGCKNTRHRDLNIMNNTTDRQQKVRLVCRWRRILAYISKCQRKMPIHRCIYHSQYY